MGNGKDIKVSELERIAAEVSEALRDLMGGVQMTPGGWTLEDWEKTLEACSRLEGQTDNLVQVLRRVARVKSWEGG